MPVTVEWDNAEKTIIRMAMVGHWTWDEAYAAFADGDQMLDGVNHRVGVIIDLRESKGVPPAALANARKMSEKQHPRAGMTVFVGANAFFLSLWSVFSKVYTLFVRKHTFTFAATIEQAREILARNVPAGQGDKPA
ncbi:MAG: hypothetical protein DWB42_18890 [Chloroflexi bacterium]|nr:hypothetical protein [Chloroflexota bacterium]MDL1885854.1 hypothetical protein [Anaerolineae bacterium CFX8]